MRKETYDPYTEDDDGYESSRRNRERQQKAKKRTVTLFVILAAAVLAVVLIAILVLTLMKDSEKGGLGGAEATSAATGIRQQEIIVPLAGTPTPMPEFTEEPEPSCTPAPSLPPEQANDLFTELSDEADPSLGQGIVNVLFIGVDYEGARTEKSWSGKSGNAFHSDVMMVCAINFDEKRVDLISLPRDTYADIPGVKGIYKLNASLNCGTDGKNFGVFCKNGEGFRKVCEAAEWMLGGMKVDYYYAVTMESVKDLIDILGGVWYELEGNFDNGGRYYKKGYQHMDGQACLDYMRVRKAGHGQLSTSDANRVNRQKRMMVELFKSVKESNLILKLPALVQTFGEGLFTNCTPAQTAALALFAFDLDPDNIGMYSMSGQQATLFHWNFIFTDQENRVNVINKIYGVKVSRESHYTVAYAKYRWAELLKSRYVDLCDGLDEYVSELLEEDDLLPESTEGPEETEEPWFEPTERPEEPDEPDEPDEPEEPDEPVEPERTPKPTEKPRTPEPEPEEPEEPERTPKPEPEEPKEPEPREPEPQQPEEDPEENEPTGLASVAVPVTYTGSVSAAQTKTRRYSKEQRELFASFQASYEEMINLFATCKKEAKKSGGSSLGTYSSQLLTVMAETQELAIKVAKSFGYTRVKNFTVKGSPTSTYVSGSPWDYAYWKDSSFNEVDVNFN